MAINILAILAVGLMPIQDPVNNELDLLWTEVSRTVEAGDFIGYSSLYHSEAVLVNGFSDKSYNISKALINWEKDFKDTKEGRIQANVTFKFSQRLHDDETAYEKGMFHYYSINEEGIRKDQYIFMDALLIKKEGKWLMLMENQISAGTKDDWEDIQ